MPTLKDIVLPFNSSSQLCSASGEVLKVDNLTIV